MYTRKIGKKTSLSPPTLSLPKKIEHLSYIYHALSLLCVTGRRLSPFRADGRGAKYDQGP
jgi:hypothetical protein